VIGQNTTGTRHKKIQMADETGLGWLDLEKMVGNLFGSCDARDYSSLDKIFDEYVDGYSKSPLVPARSENSPAIH